MKRLILPALVVCLLNLTAMAQLKDVWVAVKQNDFAGNASYSVMTEKDYRALDGELRKEGFLSTRALILAKRAWEEDESKEARFPAGLITKRRASKVGRAYTDKAEAEYKVEDLEDRERKKETDEKAKAKRGETRRNRATEEAIRSRSKGNRNNTHNREAEWRALDSKRERIQANRLREEEREMERAALQAEAVAVYEAQIEILKTAAPQEPTAH